MTTPRIDAGPLDLLVLEGDGIGPEIMAATLAVLRAADARRRLAGAPRAGHDFSR